jgi:hypothetical protein
MLPELDMATYLIGASLERWAQKHKTGASILIIVNIYRFYSRKSLAFPHLATNYRKTTKVWDLIMK